METVANSHELARVLTCNLSVTTSGYAFSAWNFGFDCVGFILSRKISGA
jgi:hypothetical protein